MSTSWSGGGSWYQDGEEEGTWIEGDGRLAWGEADDSAKLGASRRQHCGPGVSQFASDRQQRAFVSNRLVDLSSVVSRVKVPARRSPFLRPSPYISRVARARARGRSLIPLFPPFAKVVLLLLWSWPARARRHRGYTSVQLFIPRFSSLEISARFTVRSQGISDSAAKIKREREIERGRREKEVIVRERRRNEDIDRLNGESRVLWWKGGFVVSISGR